MAWGRPFCATLVRQRFGDRFSLLGGVGYPYQPPLGKEPCHEPPSHLSPPWGQSHGLPENVITNPAIQVGDFTMYHDFRNDPRAFQENNVLYHYPVNGDRLVMGKFCSIACGAVFLFTSANHALGSLSTYPFPIFFTEWGLDGARSPKPGTTRGHRPGQRCVGGL